MREEVISSGTVDPLVLARSSSPPPTPAASSAGASSPAVPTNYGSIDWLGQGQGSKAGSLSCVGSHLPRTSLSTSAGGSALGSSQPSCRPWDRGDLLRRLATFKPSNWSGKPKVAGSLACARRGWMNVGTDKIECESCGVQLSFTSLSSLATVEANSAGEAFAKELDDGHKVDCHWKGNSCAESLVQFPPTPPSALIGGYKDRCDGLLQFLCLPIIAASALEQLRFSRGPQIDRLLSQSQSYTAGEFGLRAENIPGLDSSRDDPSCIYSHAQKLISLCGWEPRWLPNVQDCEEHSAQSTRNECSVGPSRVGVRTSQDPGPSKNTFSGSTKKDPGKRKVSVSEGRGDVRSPLLDCSLCGTTVRIWDFYTVPRPSRFSASGMDAHETSKKLSLIRGVSAASAISGWVATDVAEKEQAEIRDETATADDQKSLSNAAVDLNLTMGGGLPSAQFGVPRVPQSSENENIGKDLMIGQPSSSEVGDRAVSYESRGPSSRKRSLEEGGSTVDRPLHGTLQQADSVEGTVIDRDGDEVNDGREYSGGPSKRARDSGVFSSYQRNSSGAGPSRSTGLRSFIHGSKAETSRRGNSQTLDQPSARESTRASSVIAMDTICHTGDEDSMESVENYPGELDEVHYSSPTVYKSQEMNEASELNNSNQAQQSTCFQPPSARVAGEMGISSTIEGEEIMNTETGATHTRDRFSFGISGGSVGMGASHEAEIHGTDVSVHRADSIVADAEPAAEVTENLGQTGESIPDPGLMGEFVLEEMDREDPNADNQDMISQSFGRADSGSKIDGSTKAESVESGEKMSHLVGHENSGHPSLSYNAVIYSTYEASKEEVTQAGKASLTDDCLIVESNYVAVNGPGLANGESNYEVEPMEFDPIKNHNPLCPWVNGNVAAAGCSNSSSSSSSSTIALSGWELTLDALDVFHSMGNMPLQTVESESAASMYKDEHLTPGKKLLTSRSVQDCRLPSLATLMRHAISLNIFLEARAEVMSRWRFLTESSETLFSADYVPDGKTVLTPELCFKYMKFAVLK
ncbi:hypothetical protein H6P81_019547 [Aristolochia fimbriata]|uniref:C3HC-type domain-containing protein n=1 Tax=Aristolochia fimbriata TaxID=158543 RepID=A0AAV7DV73_ARIFI|nr:hypothetical protein H6P81_019547 [Aristolochia fimbriata]